MEESLCEIAWEMYCENHKISPAFLMVKLKINYNLSVELCEYCTKRMDDGIKLITDID